MQFNYIDLVNESIDYLLFGEQAKIALDADAYVGYKTVKEAYIDIIRDLHASAPNKLAIVSSSDDLYESAIELASIVKEEAKDYVKEHYDVFVESCKKKAKEQMTEYETISDLSNAIAKEKLAEIAIYFMSVFPILTEGQLLEQKDIANDVHIGAAAILASELVHFANKHQPYCCGK